MCVWIGMPLFSGEFYADLCVDACFLLDIALCFRTAARPACSKRRLVGATACFPGRLGR